tara:strand:- start:1266 stop:2300 length:1035 start_codon:yes stop_codon:yes gene_type:complete
MIKKILITGGCGFVGSNLCIYLKKKGFKVTSLDNLYRKGSKLNYKRLKQFKIDNLLVDISKFNSVNNIRQKFDLIIDCCAEPSVEKSKNSLLEAKRVFETNLSGTFNIVAKCIKDKSKIIFLSTSRVYSISSLKKIEKFFRKKNKIPEIDVNFCTRDNKSLYGFTKFASENLIKEFNYSNGLTYLINRIGVIAGPWQFGKVDQGFISLWSWSHLTKKTLKYIGFNGDGKQVRDIIHIDDICDLIFLQITNIKKIYNKTLSFGGGKKNLINLNMLTKKFSIISKNCLKIKKVTKTSIFDIPYFVASNKQITKLYNWKPKRGIDDIILDVYNWQKKNQQLLKKYFI